MAGKGDAPRRVNQRVYQENYTATFRCLWQNTGDFYVSGCGEVYPSLPEPKEERLWSAGARRCPDCGKIIAESVQ